MPYESNYFRVYLLKEEDMDRFLKKIHLSLAVFLSRFSALPEDIARFIAFFLFTNTNSPIINNPLIKHINKDYPAGVFFSDRHRQRVRWTKTDTENPHRLRLCITGPERACRGHARRFLTD